MAQFQGPARRDARPRAKTPTERADEFAAVQRRLKTEAAERRELASEATDTPAQRRAAATRAARARRRD